MLPLGPKGFKNDVNQLNHNICMHSDCLCYIIIVFKIIYFMLLLG